MADFHAFPRVLWSEVKNRDIALAQRQFSQAYRQIFESVEGEKKAIPSDSELHGLADAIHDYVARGSEVAECYVTLAEFMDTHAVRRPLYAALHGFRRNREIAKKEKSMVEASMRIKLFWPSE